VVLNSNERVEPSESKSTCSAVSAKDIKNWWCFCYASDMTGYNKILVR
jgi:hypothetical protein